MWVNIVVVDVFAELAPACAAATSSARVGVQPHPTFHACLRDTRYPGAPGTPKIIKPVIFHSRLRGPNVSTHGQGGSGLRRTDIRTCKENKRALTNMKRQQPRKTSPSRTDPPSSGTVELNDGLRATNSGGDGRTSRCGNKSSASTIPNEGSGESSRK